MEELKEYLKKTFDIDIKITPLKKSEYQSLPLYITSSYNIYNGIILEQNICLLTFKDKDNTGTPDKLLKQMQLIEQKISCPVVYVFEKIASYNLKRYIQKRISFIIPGKQLFIPALMLDLRKLPTTIEKESDYLVPVAQFLILYHLQKERIDGITVKQLSDKFSQTYITINRAVKNLENLGLCKLDGIKEKRIIFREHGKALWEKSFKVMQIPVERTVYTDENIDLQNVCKSNINALAYYTYLNDERKQYYAIDKREVSNIRSIANKYNGENNIEIWRYNPLSLSENGFIDKLSLYLLLQDNNDERIKIELEKMLSEIKWLEE